MCSSDLYFPAPHTPYAAIRKLPGGCTLTYDIRYGISKIERYWRFTLQADEGLNRVPVNRLAEELRSLLTQAVHRRLISDVPLGVFLSGGIDSSAILACATTNVPNARIKSFTVGFTEPSFDESQYARAAAAQFGTDHNVEMLDLSAAQRLIPEVLGRLDEPFGDASVLPTFLLSRLTRQHVTVALSGDGGDELFAGYDPFQALQPAHFYTRLVPRGLHRGLRKLTDLLPISHKNMSLDFKLRRALTGVSYPEAMWNPAWFAPVEPQKMAEIFHRPISAEELYSETIDIWEAKIGRAHV